MRLEDQLSALDELGLSLAEGRTVEELLLSYERAEYEAEPFELLLAMLGSEVEDEPWGRRFSEHVWSFDTECVYDDDAYIEIASELCRLADRPDVSAGLRSHVDIEAGQGWISYSVDGRSRRWEVEVDDDWADGTVVERIMKDLEHDGRRFYAMDNGQVAVLFFVTDTTAERLNTLAGRRIVAPAVD